jgi:CheY-like chemotaxis protein
MKNSGIKQTSILIIDDDLFFRDIFKTSLKQLGITKVTAVGNARAAAELLEQGTIDVHVILLDLDMPGMNGIAFLQMIRDSHDRKIAELPVIIVSAYVTDAVKEDLARFDILGFLGKPPDMGDLKRLIGALGK